MEAHTLLLVLAVLGSGFTCSGGAEGTYLGKKPPGRRKVKRLWGSPVTTPNSCTVVFLGSVVIYIIL